MKELFDFIELRRGLVGIDKLINISELQLQNQIKSVVSEAVSRDIHIIRLAGPSGSGKTTTAKRIVDEAKSIGKTAYYISMDNWYKTLNTEEIPKNKFGEPDFESPMLLDIDGFKEDIHKLSGGEPINLREFDFINRISHITDKQIKCDKDSIIVIEGLHAINPIFDTQDKVLKVYVEPSDVQFENDEVLTSSGIRLLRRIHRDKADRGMGMLDTINKCRSVDIGEDQYITPYADKSDVIKVDTLLPYELYIHKTEFEKEVAEQNEKYSVLDIIKELINRGMIDDIGVMRNVPDVKIDMSKIPEKSILREFYK